MSTGVWALFAATILSIELLRASHLFPAFHRLSAHGRRSARLFLRSRVSEWAKERALGLASRRMFALSFAAGARLVLVASPFAAAIWLDRLYPFELTQAWGNWSARFWLLLTTSVYILLRRGARRGDRTFQRLALGSSSLIEMSFDIERAVHRRRAATIPLVAPVFITGLARSGTSVLTRELHREADCASLSYRDLPFPLAPNLWRRISRTWARSIASAERGHGDGLLHDLDSPEAIEEIFWLCHEGERFRKADRILPVTPRPETCDAFRDYVRLVLLRYGATRYLSKNNANILRLPALVDAFPDAVLVHPFRDPLQQAASLRHQHLRACALAAEDPYRARFMAWLGHHEFGADHRPIHFPGAPAPAGDPANLDYWLHLWVESYTFLLAQPPSIRARQIFLDYDMLCRKPHIIAERLSGVLRLDTPLRFRGIRPSIAHMNGDGDPTLKVRARALHAKLIDKARFDIGLADGAMLPRTSIRLEHVALDTGRRREPLPEPTIDQLRTSNRSV